MSTDPLASGGADSGSAPADPLPGGPASVERALAALAMAALCLITFANVVARYFTNVSFAFTEEYSITLMVAMTFLGAAVAAARDRHIRITVAVDGLPRPVRRAAEVAAGLATLVLFTLLVWYGARLTWDQWRFEETSPALGNPQWLYTLCMPVLCAVVALRVAGRLLRTRGGRV